MIARLMTLGVAALFALSLTTIAPAIAAQGSDTAVKTQTGSVQVAASHGGGDASMPKKKKKKKKKKKQ